MLFSFLVLGQPKKYLCGNSLKELLTGRSLKRSQMALIAVHTILLKYVCLLPRGQFFLRFDVAKNFIFFKIYSFFNL